MTWTPAAERVMRRVAAEGDCLVFTGCRDPRGYGRVADRLPDGRWRSALAHRVVYLAEHGPLPEGVEVRHSCDNPPCVKLAHLERGSHADNMHDMAQRGRGRGRRTVLTSEEEAEIRASPKIVATYLAQQFGVSVDAVRRTRRQ